MEKAKREKALRDLRSFGLGAAWALPTIETIRELILTRYQSIRWDLLWISIAIAILFIYTGRDTYQ